MKRSTILISISYLLFVGLNIGLSIVLVNQIKENNQLVVVVNQGFSDEVKADQPFDIHKLTDLDYVKSSIRNQISSVKELVVEEFQSVTSSRDRNDQVKNYIPLNPVYNFLQ